MRTIGMVIGLLIGCTGLARAAEPLTLEQAREQAKKNNPTLLLARETLYQANVFIDKAWVGVKPQIGVTGTYTHTEPSASLDFPDFQSVFENIIFNADQDPNICAGQMVCIDWPNVDTTKTDIIKRDSFGATASLYQPLFNARAFAAIKQAGSAYDLSRINTQNLEDYLLHTVDIAYYSALTARKYLVAAQKAVVLRQEHLKIARAKFEVGDQPKITALRAEIDLNQAEQDVKTAENSVAMARESIALLIGRDDAAFELVEPEPNKRPGETLDTFIERALAQRRDLEVGRISLEIAERSKRDAWYRFLPTLGLTGMFRATDTKGFTGEYYSWNVGLALTIPLYDGGMRYAELDSAESQIRQAQIRIEQTKASIRSEIRQDWLSLESAEANLEKAQKALELAEEQAELSKVSFEAGAITNLEVLDANHLVFLSEVSLAQLELQYQLAIMKLEKAVRMFNPAGSASMGGASMGGASGASTAGAGASMGGAPTGGASMGGAGGAPTGMGM